MGVELLFLLLPVAALSGWLLGRRDVRDGGRQFSSLSSDYFKGLNYLLNEQPDKAIEVFIHMLEVDSDTVDTHFAVGSLFRRRGEVDRAIRIHQNLIARPTLSRQQRDQALYELGTDYMRAGLLDRAESLFQELVNESPAYRPQALRQLLDIYQQEKDWHKAVAIGQRLQGMGSEGVGPVIAQFFCEQADQALMLGERSEALGLVRRALAEDRNCVRATLLEGRIELDNGAHKSAVRVLRRVEQQNPAYLPEVLAPLQEAFVQQGRIGDMIAYLRDMLARHGGISIMLALAELIRQQQGEKEAAVFVVNHMRGHPSVRGMERLIALKLHSSDGQARDDLLVLKDLTDKLLESKPVYCCSQCGYSGKNLSWQCPSCKQWNTIKPIHGIEGE
ncbi:MAG: lipopolysaccharide assembly protein LapB [Pseudomonadota bacterium]